MNGTQFNRIKQKNLTEQELVNVISEKTKDYNQVLMLMSTTNIDRVTTLIKVANKTHRTPIYDLLLSNVMQEVTQAIPNPLNNSKVYVYMPTYLYWLRNKPEYRPYIEPFEQKMKLTGRKLREGNFIMNIRVSMLRDIEKLYRIKVLSSEKTCVCWGLWNGYKEEEEYKNFLKKMEELKIPVIDAHTSGHRRLYSIQATI